MSGIPRNMSQSSKRSAKYRNPKGPAKYFGFYRNHRLIDEIIENEEKDYASEYLEKGIVKDSLNSEIWENNKIKSEIRIDLLKLAKEYLKFLGIDSLPEDIVLTGSIANYNWNENSDIDVHLIFDYNDIDDDEDFVMEFMKTKKDLWAENHDIKIKGFDVELFGQNKNQKLKKHAAEYSLLNDEWIVEPKKVKLKLNKNKIKELVFQIVKKVDVIERIQDRDKKIFEIDKLTDEIKNIRQKGLEANGEYGEENIVFKILRGYDVLNKVYDMKNDAIDTEYSISENIKKVIKKNLIESHIKDDFRGIKFETKKFQPNNDDEYYYSLDKSKNYHDINETLADTQPLNHLFVKSDLDFEDKKIEYIRDFISFVCDKLKMKDGVSVFLRNGRDNYIATTASYVPSNNTNHIRCGNRAIIDILRSIAHELVHNRQRELEMFNPEKGVQNIGGDIEDQANSVAGIFIKDFTHNYGYDSVYDF